MEKLGASGQEGVAIKVRIGKDLGPYDELFKGRS